MEKQGVPANTNTRNLGDGAGRQPPLADKVHNQVDFENQLGDAFMVETQAPPRLQNY